MFLYEYNSEHRDLLQVALASRFSERIFSSRIQALQRTEAWQVGVPSDVCNP